MTKKKALIQFPVALAKAVDHPFSWKLLNILRAILYDTKTPSKSLIGDRFGIDALGIVEIRMIGK